MEPRWSKEQAWEWYKKQPWIRGCHYTGSDCANRIDQWQEYKFEEHFKTWDSEMALAQSIGFNSIRVIVEYAVWEAQHDGFMDRLDKYLTSAYSHGIRTMLVLSNECAVRTAVYEPPVFGEQPYYPACHGGMKTTVWYEHGSDKRFNLLDDPEIAPKYYEMVREIIEKYARDDRVIAWNLMNEPGNARGNKSWNHLIRFFEIGREIDPMQPLCADVWRGMKNCRPNTEIEQLALDLSDVISYHCYGSYEENIDYIMQLRKLGRPALNTEWMNRLNPTNRVDLLFPLFCLERIGSYSFGFVAGKMCYNEPAQGIWLKYQQQGYDAVKHLDLTKWQHDLFRLNQMPYDPKEIEVIKKYSRLADETQEEWRKTYNPEFFM